MIRIADIKDAEQLFVLNENFNGKGETTLSEIKKSLFSNNQEIVIVAEENNILVGFICVQLKKSFCYSDIYAEITEVFVLKEHRRKKYASKMISFAEQYCTENYQLHNFEILTGKDNTQAQLLYDSLKYSTEDEIVYTKRISQ